VDRWVERILAAAFLRFRRRKVANTAAVMRRGLGEYASEVDIVAATRNFYEGIAEYTVGRVRGMHPGAWDPEIVVEGREHVDAALAAGRGAILWRMSMGDTMQLQRAAWQSGWPLVQLSAQAHGATYSRASERVTAPLYARPENAYLVERVRIPLDWSIGYLPRLLRALQANQVVAMLSEVIGRQNTAVRVLAGWRAIPTGAPAIAHRTGAALIPAATFRDGRERYRVRLGPPIEVDRSRPRGEAAEDATREFARRLEAAVLEHPGDYRGWWTLQYPPEGQQPVVEAPSEEG
jgi:lauroyl/myristoyl acyltransferase